MNRLRLFRVRWSNRQQMHSDVFLLTMLNRCITLALVSLGLSSTCSVSSCSFLQCWFPVHIVLFTQSSQEKELLISEEYVFETSYFGIFWCIALTEIESNEWWITEANKSVMYGSVVACMAAAVSFHEYWKVSPFSCRDGASWWRTMMRSRDNSPGESIGRWL